jgi:hypothetical protein
VKKLLTLKLVEARREDDRILSEGDSRIQEIKAIKLLAHRKDQVIMVDKLDSKVSCSRNKEISLKRIPAPRSILGSEELSEVLSLCRVIEEDVDVTRRSARFELDAQVLLDRCLVQDRPSKAPGDVAPAMDHFSDWVRIKNHPDHFLVRVCRNGLAGSDRINIAVQ